MKIFLEKVRSMVNFSLAIKICLVLFGIFSVFHFAVIIGIVVFNIVPLEYLWGGRMQTKDELLLFEIVSLVIQVLCYWVVVLKRKHIKMGQHNLVVESVIWILCFVFFLNTIGNLVAKTMMETLLGTPITAILFVLLFRIGIEKKIELA